MDQIGYPTTAKVPSEVTPEQKQLAELQQQFMHAKVEFDEACHDAARAFQRRERATQEFSKVAEVLHQAIQSAGYDPTQPHAVPQNINVGAGIALNAPAPGRYVINT